MSFLSVDLILSRAQVVSKLKVTTLIEVVEYIVSKIQQRKCVLPLFSAVYQSVTM